MIFVYLDVAESILLKSTDTAFKALYYIFEQMDQETKIWFADLKNKEEIAEKLGVTVHAVHKMVLSLRERGLLINTTKSGKYKLNPEIFES